LTIRFPLFSLRDQGKMEIWKQESEIEISRLPAISINGYVDGRLIKALWALEWAWSVMGVRVGVSYGR